MIELLIEDQLVRLQSSLEDLESIDSTVLLASRRLSDIRNSCKSVASSSASSGAATAAVAGGGGCTTEVAVSTAAVATESDDVNDKIKQINNEDEDAIFCQSGKDGERKRERESFAFVQDFALSCMSTSLSY